MNFIEGPFGSCSGCARGPYHRKGLAKISLTMARRMTQRHEHLTATQVFLTSVFLHYRVTATLSMFLLNLLKDTFDGMALLSGFVLVRFQDDINDTCE
ncbi:uncharacterized protein METZ01_LOCUS510318 [marine metagenome]|uniref:Uncharacterized protein n=1 Tax=marine metagenome TaxID=408172 RepID=A0A383ELJ1_9ZZZZ